MSTGSSSEPRAGSAPPGDGTAPTQKFPIAGIGASAGGLEAVTELLRHLPPNPGMGLVLVQHLDPRHPSLLAEILSRETMLRVTQAHDGERVEKDVVYVIPPNHSLSIEGGRLILTPRDEVRGPFMPIDCFFRSLARDQGNLSVAVVLSGGGADGALGLAEVKAADGITFAQDESTARHDTMPRSAIATESVDFVLAPAGIAQELARLGREFFPPAASGRTEPGPDDAAGVQKILHLVRGAMGVDFSHYKPNTIRRRIRRRMGVCRTESIDDYLALLQDRPAEVEALYQDFLIRVTSFFRDPGTFAALQQSVIPNLTRDRLPGEPIRLWVVGCSTGEEAYSLAIVLMEALGDKAGHTTVKILATDVNEAALERARAGVYLDNISMDVSAERLRRFFVQSNGNYQISKAIRDLCVFSRHNLVKDTPFANLDLISCRNLLIYLDLPLQKRVMPYLHYALRSHGYLMLGTSETIGSFGELFEVQDKEHRIFVKKATKTRTLIDLPAGERDPAWGVRAALAAPEAISAQDIQREADRVLLTRYVPPGVVIDENLTILQFRGKIGPYLSPIPGAASLELLKMLREGLAPTVREAIEQSKAGNVRVKREGLHIAEADRSRLVTLEVIPLRAIDATRYLIVLFDDVAPGAPAQHLSQPAAPPTGAEPADQARAQQIERELTATREYLQSIVEENEATNEELKAANEEILSSNEELQSTNEELQTAKEEMQSANEELATVNDELKHRNREVGEVNDDLVNLLAGLDIPIIMVNRELRIRRFTPPAESMFHVIASDVGRPIGDLRPELRVPDLHKLIRTVIDSLHAQELDVQDEQGRWHSLRIRPYVTADNKIDGAAIAVVNIDVMKQAHDQMKAARNYAEAIVETVWEPLLVLDEKLHVRRANPRFYRAFQLSREEVEHRLLFDVGDRQWDHPELRSRLGAIISGQSGIRDFEIEAEFPGLGPRSMLINAHRILWEGSGTPMVLLAIDDVTDRKREVQQARLLAREQAARAEAEASSRMKDEFLAMLAHELRNPLAPIRNTLYILRQRFAQDPIASHAVQMSERQIAHMARLLDDLLDVSRISRGKIQLRKELLELKTAVSRAVETSHHLIDSRQHRLDVSLPSEPVYLEADPARFEQILCNLLNNAAKYTDAGGQISLSVTPEDGFVVIRVSDTGIGISAEMLPRIFDLFTQVDRSLDRALGGLGIGLTLVKTLVQLHGGSIEAASDGAGKGSTFIVRLPAVPRRDTALSARESEKTRPASASRRILVVDDNVDAAQTLAVALRMVGHQVETAYSGPAALESATTNQPDVILLDIGLPGMNGYEVAKRLRAAPQNETTIIAVTGYGQEQDRRQADEAGIDHLLIKLVDLGELERLLEILLARKRGAP